MNPSVMLGLSNIGVAVLLIAISIPLIQRRVKMNHFYGVRIPKAFESDENWYKINEYGGRQLVLWSCVLALLGVVTFFLPLGTEEKPNETMIIISALMPLIVLVPAIVQILRYARKL